MYNSLLVIPAFDQPSARMHSEGYGSCVCVCVCVLPFQLTSRWFIRPTNDTTYIPWVMAPVYKLPHH